MGQAIPGRAKRAVWEDVNGPLCAWGRGTIPGTPLVNRNYEVELIEKKE